MTSGRPLRRSRYGGPGARVVATAVDVIVYVSTVVAVAVPVGAAGGSGAQFLAGSAMAVLMWAVFVALVATRGWTPGKRVMGLRVTAEDATTTPPGWSPAVFRTLPSLVNAIPGIGGLLSLLLYALNLVLVYGDDQRRSVFDLVGRTRVVKVDDLLAS